MLSRIALICWYLVQAIPQHKTDKLNKIKITICTAKLACNIDSKIPDFSPTFVEVCVSTASVSRDNKRVKVKLVSKIFFFMELS